mgnify:FL=1
MIKLAIVDDKYQNRHSLAEKIVYSNEVEIVFSAVNGKDFLDKMKTSTSETRPEVVLMDIEMPEMDGIQAVYNGNILYPEVKFIMLTVFDDDDKLFEAIKAGASGYFLKDEKILTILEGLKQAIFEEGAPMSPRIARKTLQLMVNPIAKEKQVVEQSDLSAREMEILKLLVQGSDYKSIAEKLFISPNTVRKHIANIYTKLQISNKVQLVNLAAKNNW